MHGQGGVQLSVQVAVCAHRAMCAYMPDLKQSTQGAPGFTRRWRMCSYLCNLRFELRFDCKATQNLLQHHVFMSAIAYAIFIGKNNTNTG